MTTVSGSYGGRTFSVDPTLSHLLAREDTSAGVYAVSGLMHSAGDEHRCLYIGSAQNFKKRIFYNHLNALKHGYHCNDSLQRAWDKYSPTGFAFLALEHCSVDQRVEREQNWIDYYASELGFDSIHNASDIAGVPKQVSSAEWAERKKQGKQRRYSKPRARGKDHPSYGRKVSAEERLKISISQKKRFARQGPPSTESRKYLSDLFRGRPNIRDRKPVKQIDLQSGNVIEIWPSIKAAATALKINGSGIARCANWLAGFGGEKKITTSHKYRWEFVLGEELAAYNVKHYGVDALQCKYVVSLAKEQA